MQSVNLSRCELIAINRCYLGGFDALRTPDYSVACSTMKSLIKKGMFEKRGLSKWRMNWKLQAFNSPLPAFV